MTNLVAAGAASASQNSKVSYYYSIGKNLIKFLQMNNVVGPLPAKCPVIPCVTDVDMTNIIFIGFIKFDFSLLL